MECLNVKKAFLLFCVHNDCNINTIIELHVSLLRKMCTPFKNYIQFYKSKMEGCAGNTAPVGLLYW